MSNGYGCTGECRSATRHVASHDTSRSPSGLIPSRSRLQVNTAAVNREVCHHKFTRADVGDDLVADFFVVFNFIHAMRCEVTINPYSGLYAQSIGVIQSLVEGH